MARFVDLPMVDLGKRSEDLLPASLKKRTWALSKAFVSKERPVKPPGTISGAKHALLGRCLLGERA